MELSKKQIGYYKKWQKTRQNKFRFLFKKGVLQWAIPFSIVMTLFDLSDYRFNFSNKILIHFLEFFVISSVLGICTALYTFNKTDKKYLELKEKSLI